MPHEHADRVIVDVGLRIAEIRRTLGWTQQHAAERLRMPLKNLQRIEAGMNLTIRTLVRIAAGFGVATRTLFELPVSRERRVGRPRQRSEPASMVTERAEKSQPRLGRRLGSRKR